MTTAVAPMPVATGPTWWRRPDGKFLLPERTLGWDVIDWAEKWLLQPDGPEAGAPWRYTNEQQRFILWWYALNEVDRFLYRSGMLRRMKGWGKDPLVASLACVELLGPCRSEHGRAVPHFAPTVQIAAVSQDQVKRNTMSLFPAMLSARAVSEFGVDVGKEIIYAHQGRGRIELLTSSSRSAEGPRPTLILKNETQHWIKANGGEDMSDVCSRNAAKSRDGSTRTLAISNAHNPGEDSDAERDYEAHLKIEQGQNRTADFMYDSLEAPPDTVLSDEESLRAGLVCARGDSTWLDVDRLVAEIYDPRTAPSTSRRFYLNQIVATEDAWVTPQQWDALARPGEKVEPGELITLGLDGSKSDDNTALMGCRVRDAFLFTLGIWDPEKHGGEIPRAEVTAAVERAMEQFDVVGFLSDVHPFESYIDEWEEKYGPDLCVRSQERHPIGWDMRGRKQETTRAAEGFNAAIVEGTVSHDGDKVLAEHVHNARRMPNNYGVTFRKESPFSAKKIDGCAAAMLARQSRQMYIALPENKKRQVARPTGVSVYIPGEDDSP